MSIFSNHPTKVHFATVFWTIGAVSIWAASAGDKDAARPPNILFILADDLGFGDVACYNPESKVPTPHLDQMARDGIRFTDAHSPSTVCTPTRYSCLTGRMAFRTGYRGVYVGVGGPCLIEKDRLTLPGMLREAGYRTALMGKWHIGLSFYDKEGKRIERSDNEGVAMVDYTRSITDGPLHRGFDDFFGTACCPTTDWLYAYIDGDRIPVPPTRLLDRATLPSHPYSFDCRGGYIAPDFEMTEVDLKFLEKSVAFLENHVAERKEQPFFLFHSMQAVHLPSFPGKDFLGKTDAGPHGDFIFEMDHIVGELLVTLDRLGLRDDTLVIFSSDNGPEVGTVFHMRNDHQHDGARPWRGVKRDQWEGGHRVPFLARWPGKIPAGAISDETICLTDLMATCAALVGVELPDNAAEDSFDILPALLAKDLDKPIRPYTLHQTIRLDLAIRQGKWKYLDHKGSGGNVYQPKHRFLKDWMIADTAPDSPGQLYNLEADPGERDNLVNIHPEIASRLKAILDESKRSGRSRELRKND